MNPSYDRPMASNNGTNMRSDVMQTTPGSSDIVLAPEKKKHTRLIIGIVVVFILIIVGIIAFVMIILKSQNSGIVTTNYKEAFNLYANYALFGKDSIEDVDWEKLDSASVSYFEQNVVMESDSDKKETVIGKMKELYDGFSNQYAEKRSDYINKILSYGKKIDLLNTYYSDGIPSKAALLEAYQKGGNNEANLVVDGFSDLYKEYDGLYIENISELVKKYGSTQLGQIGEYTEIGCVVDGSIDYACALSIGDGELDRLLHEGSDYLNSIRVIIAASGLDVELDLNSIADTVIDIPSETEGESDEA